MSDILKKIEDNKDLKKLSLPQLLQLCRELRVFLVSNVSKSGGHLASNLGTVELTVALHYVFNPHEDRIVWDVGHQSYVHKILTGRRDAFSALRSSGGISGFPKRSESDCDAFNTGHSSTSISAALGIARARDLCGGSYDVISVFGDGALTGGMMYEAMNDAGRSASKLIMILNDNEMSISRNVGAISKHLQKLRMKSGYYKSKEIVEDFLDKLPIIGKNMKSAVSRIKNAVRYSVLPTTIFDDFGFEYMGPVDGHDLPKLIELLCEAKKKKKSVVIHINTKKGNGYAPAEMHPDVYHGVGCFDPEIGVVLHEKKDYSAVMGKKLCSIAAENDRVVAITGAMREGTGLSEFSRLYKNRFYDVGIAEQHAVTMGAGMAVGGFIPVFAVYSSFLQRAYDQILHDVCLQKLHMVFCVDRAGLVGCDGETHQGAYDISFLSHMPYMSILSPCCFDELEQMLAYAINVHTGPIAVRYPRGNEQYEISHRFEFGKGYILKNGQDAAIAATGRMVKRAIEVSELLEKEGINVTVAEIPTVKPIDKELIKDIAENHLRLFTIEDNVYRGGMGEEIAGIIAGGCTGCRVSSYTLPDTPVKHGSPDVVEHIIGLDAKGIADSILNNIRRK